MLRRTQDGVTLVELLVVVLIVVILALSMVPLMQQHIIRAKYAAEAIPSVGRVVGQLEQAAHTIVTNMGQTNASSRLHGELLHPFFQSTVILMPHGGFAVLNELSGEVVPQSQNAILPAWMVSLTEGLAGKLFTAEDYQIRIEHWDPQKREFMFAVAATGDGREGGLPTGTGFASLVASFETANGRRRLKGVWEQFAPNPEKYNRRLCLTVADTDDEHKLHAIVMPEYESLRSATDPERLLQDIGWR